MSVSDQKLLMHVVKPVANFVNTVRILARYIARHQRPVTKVHPASLRNLKHVEVHVVLLITALTLFRHIFILIY